MSLQKLDLHDFSFSYGGKTVLSHISMEINKGDFVCICGPNGAGKSTLMKSLFDCVPCKSFKEKARLVSFLSQNEKSMWEYSVFDVILSGRYCHTGLLGNYSKNDYEICEKVIKDFGLEELRDKSVLEISGGEFQKVRLARAFAQESDFLLLDEPLSSLDFVVSKDFMKVLKDKCRSKNKGILISIHDINIASRFADRLILLGKYNSEKEMQPYFSGTVDEVMTSKNLSLVYESNVEVYSHPKSGIPQI